MELCGTEARREFVFLSAQRTDKFDTQSIRQCMWASQTRGNNPSCSQSACPYATSPATKRRVSNVNIRERQYTYHLFFDRPQFAGLRPTSESLHAQYLEGRVSPPVCGKETQNHCVYVCVSGPVCVCVYVVMGACVDAEHQRVIMVLWTAAGPS